jgi:Asp-tRNA(Asn)/Glu-tRNA(Gln) amidotransferase A subunit family amidase
MARMSCRIPHGLLFLAALAAGPATASQTRSLELLTASIADLQAAVAAGALTYERLVHMYLARIGAYDKAGPALNAVIAINPRAIEIARARDDERRRTGLRSPLHGIPIAVKDNIDTTAMPTTGGNPVFAAVAPTRDATVLERLERAGAIIFVKTNLDELAMSSQGFSTVGGQTLNPYDLTRSPGGSSGGTAVAVSAGFAAAGLATETGISIRGPAANTGLVAIAPTRGLVSRAGVIPISFTQDRVGVHARSVADAALVLSYIRGFDAEDLVTAESLGRDETTPFTGDPTRTLTGVRIGVLEDLFRTDPEFAAANTLVRQQVELLKRRGATIVDGQETGRDLVAMMPTLRLNSFELRPAFDAYLRRRGTSAPVQSLMEFIARGQYIKSGNLEVRFAETMTVDVLDFDDEYRQRLLARSELRSLLIGLLDAHDLDALVYPVKSLGAPPIGQADTGPRDNPISSVSGLPAVVVPVGLGPDGLPLAMELLGFPFNERPLLDIAAVYERLRGPRVQPKTTPPLPGDAIEY